MPEEISLYQSEPIYILNSWKSEWLNVSRLSEINFTVYNNKTFDVGLRWSIDNNYQVIEEVVYLALNNETKNISIPVIARFLQFYVENITSPPSILESCGFFYLDE